MIPVSNLLDGIELSTQDSEPTSSIFLSQHYMVNYQVNTSEFNCEFSINFYPKYVRTNIFNKLTEEVCVWQYAQYIVRFCLTFTLLFFSVSNYQQLL